MSFRVILLIYLAYREAADADAQGSVGLLKCTGFFKSMVMTGVRLTVCGIFFFAPFCACIAGIQSEGRASPTRRQQVGRRLQWPGWEATGQHGVLHRRRPAAPAGQARLHRH